MVSVRIAKKKFTVREYNLMAKTGILQEGDRLELIEGEIVEMSIESTKATKSLS